MGSTIYVGLASSAVYQLDTSTNQRIKLNTAIFDNVSISTPPVAVADTYSVNEDTTLTVDAFTGRPGQRLRSRGRSADRRRRIGHARVDA